jgi:hypothetical protein
MKRLTWRVTGVIAYIAASIVGGWGLGKTFSALEFEIPFWLDVTIRAGMHMAGARDPLDPEDIETFGLFTLWLAYSLLVAVVLGIVLFLVRRYRETHRAR